MITCTTIAVALAVATLLAGPACAVRRFAPGP